MVSLHKCIFIDAFNEVAEAAAAEKELQEWFGCEFRKFGCVTFLVMCHVRNWLITGLVSPLMLFDIQFPFSIKDIYYYTANGNAN